MKSGEFLQQVRTKSVVEVGGSKLDARTWPLSGAMASSLDLALGTDDEIFAGIETSTIDDDGKGALTWCLISGRQFVRATLEIKGPAVSQAAHSRVELFPLSSLAGATLETESPESPSGRGAVVKSASLVLLFADGPTIAVESTRRLPPAALGQFLRVAMAGSGR